MAFTPEQLNPVYGRIEHRKQLEPNFSLSYDYLSGKLDQPPVFTFYYDNDQFAKLYDLSLQPGITPENESLLFSFFSCKNMADRVYPIIARNIFIPLKDSQDQAAFDKALAIISKLPFTNDDLFYLLLHSVTFTKDEILSGSSPMLNFMHAHTVQMSEVSINDAVQFTRSGNFDWHLFLFIYRNRKDKADQYVENWKMFYVDKRCNEVVLRAALDIEFSRFGPMYKEMAEARYADRTTISEGYMIYLNYNDFSPESDSKELVHWSEGYLDFFIKYKIYEFESGFRSLKYMISDEDRFYLPMHGWALFFVLKENEARGKELFERLLAQGLVLKQDVLVMLKHVMGASVIPYILKAVFQQDWKHLENERLEYIFRELTTAKGQFDIDILWQFEKYQSRQAESLAINFLLQHDKGVTQKAIKAIEDKKKEIRLMAARILLELGVPEAMETLKKALDKETDDATRDLIWQTCGREISAPVTEATIGEMVEGAKKRGKLKRPVFTWLDETTLPGLYLQSGHQLNADEVRLILYRMSRAKGMRSDPEIKPVLQLIDREKSADFAKSVYKAFEEKQFDSKYKFLLLLAALFGNDDMVNKFCSALNKWIEGSRKVMCEYGIEALALQGSNKALRWIEWYSRKYRNKKTYISEAAAKALTAAAEELEITIHELGDRIVPDFGFEGLFKHFTVAGDEYRAFIDSNFKLAYFNEDNKKLKSIPAAADKEMVAEFKSIAKEVRDVVKAQSSRLEHYLVVQRKWIFEEWQQFFLNNPIMFIYANKLLWGVYNKGQQLVSCFLCQEDTTLVDKEGDETEAPEGHFIGIVHPISLSQEELQTWKRQFFDLSIEPVFPQLERSVYMVADEDNAKRVVHSFVNVPTDSGSVKNTLDKHGWRKSDTGDGGYINTFHYSDHASKIVAELAVDGVLVYGFDDEAKLQQLCFIDTTVKKTYNSGVSYTDRDERLIQLGKLSPVFYSEVVAAIKAIKVRDTKKAAQ